MLYLVKLKKDVRCENLAFLVCGFLPSVMPLRKARTLSEVSSFRSLSPYSLQNLNISSSYALTVFFFRICFVVFQPIIYRLRNFHNVASFLNGLIKNAELRLDKLYDIQKITAIILWSQIVTERGKLSTAGGRRRKALDNRFFRNWPPLPG